MQLLYAAQTKINFKTKLGGYSTLQNLIHLKYCLFQSRLSHDKLFFIKQINKIAKGVYACPTSNQYDFTCFYFFKL